MDNDSIDILSDDFIIREKTVFKGIRFPSLQVKRVQLIVDNRRKDGEKVCFSDIIKEAIDEYLATRY